MNSFMNISRMNLQYYMEDEFIFEGYLEDLPKDGHCLQIEPILHRDGIFKRGKECWFEVRGQAFTYPLETFNFEYSLLNLPSLSQQQMAALKMVVGTKMATKGQRELYYRLMYRVENLNNRLEIYKSQKRFDMLHK